MNNTKNPYEPGTDEYLDWATKQHTEATSPKPKEIKKTKKKPIAKKKTSSTDRIKELQERQKKYTGGLAGMLGL